MQEFNVLTFHFLSPSKDKGSRSDIADVTVWSSVETTALMGSSSELGGPAGLEKL